MGMSEVSLGQVCESVERLWPQKEAEAWDRVGLVCGDPQAPVRRVLFAVDPVAETVEEAKEWGADLLLTHHPLMLRGVHSVAENTAKGALVAELVRAGCALFAAHTNADKPLEGVSAVLAEELGVVKDLRPIEPSGPGAQAGAGIGRVGELAQPVRLDEFARRVACALPPTAWGIRVAGDPATEIRTVALCGGAGDSLLTHPLVRAADLYLTSDLRHHPASESMELAIVEKKYGIAAGPALIDVSHWAAESLWLSRAATLLCEALPQLQVRVSQRCTDPWTFHIAQNNTPALP